MDNKVETPVAKAVLDRPVVNTTSEMYVGYSQECIVDKHSCGNNEVVRRTPMTIKFCCSDAARQFGRELKFREDRYENGARKSLMLGGKDEAVKFCMYCGAPIVLEMSELK